MLRKLPIVGCVAALALTGCAGTWDAVTSRKFRKEPFTMTYRLWKPEDPVVVLKADPPRDGDERAKAMRRLKEPLPAGLSQQDQDWAVDLLARAATADPSPLLRLAAVDALGRFDDPRAAGILMLAYQKAHGRADGVADPFKADSVIQPVAGRVPGRTVAALPLTPPTGFAPDTVAAIRGRAVEAIGRDGRPETIRFMAGVANGPAADAPDGADDRDVRLAAVRGLGSCRQPGAVVALAQVLATENGKDTAIAGRAHDGLVRLTGKKLPPEPQKWNEVVQAGVVIAPEPGWVDRTVETAAGWVKP